METDLHRVIYSRQVSTQHNLIGINWWSHSILHLSIT
jgi:hypothetical protein